MLLHSYGSGHLLLYIYFVFRIGIRRLNSSSILLIVKKACIVRVFVQMRK